MSERESRPHGADGNLGDREVTSSDITFHRHETAAVTASRFFEPDARRAPDRDESLRDWSQRQTNPLKATVDGNAAILARLSRRGRR